MSVFARLPPRLQEAIVARLGWSSLRPVQEDAGEALLAGMNAVVLAPTAGGKTEATVFPLLASLMNDPPQSVAALYAAPIKALLNNQSERLGLYTEMVGLSRCVWHGDTPEGERRQLLREPAPLLMTTPESLEVMLMSPRVDAAKLFRDLRVVIVDEVHALAGTDRGAHLMSVLERLTVWFTACWLFASGKDGISALSLKRTLEIGSYQTAWAMLHRLRSVLVRPRRERLAGVVEVDETYIGGLEPGLPGGRARGKKVLTGIVVEIREPRGIGRCRMLPLADASAATLLPFVNDHVEPGTRVITDGWQGYRGLEKIGYVHDRRSQRAARSRGDDPGELLPAVHRVASLAKRWLLGTHQGAVDDAHLASYLDEFVFRFNHRRSRSRGMVFYRILELAVAHDPVRYHDIVATQRPRREPPTPPGRCGHPPSLERPPANRPWRAVESGSG